MTWNYRLVKYADGSGFGVHEVYYDDDGNPKSMSSKPTGFAGETADEVNQAMIRARSDVARRGVLEEPVEWGSDDAELNQFELSIGASLQGSVVISVETERDGKPIILSRRVDVEQAHRIRQKLDNAIELAIEGLAEKQPDEQ